MKHLLFGRAQSTRVQFFRYLFVGGSSTVVDLAVYFLFSWQLGKSLYLLHAFAAYMAGLVFNHVLSVLWVFESKHSRMKEVLLVFAIAMGGLFWTELFLWIGVDYFGGDPFITKLGVVAIVLTWNFGLRKLVVFH